MSLRSLWTLIELLDGKFMEAVNHGVGFHYTYDRISLYVHDRFKVASSDEAI